MSPNSCPLHNDCFDPNEKAALLSRTADLLKITFFGISPDYLFTNGHKSNTDLICPFLFKMAGNRLYLKNGCHINLTYSLWYLILFYTSCVPRALESDWNWVHMLEKKYWLDFQCQCSTIQNPQAVSSTHDGFGRVDFNPVFESWIVVSGPSAQKHWHEIPSAGPFDVHSRKKIYLTASIIIIILLSVGSTPWCFMRAALSLWFRIVLREYYAKPQ